ncbi:hypothetical protein Hypma_008966 [Hypsizygus marmoreus]|uniref:BTB domain-containing protein n=1 Tax=Hypsizygus marmoreus TaxID=39966 RepID=A0A369JTD7_HYPMA|nr:hypothetical protein Hypma_008966 [Hypsizygus marmoreus]
MSTTHSPSVADPTRQSMTLFIKTHPIIDDLDSDLVLRSRCGVDFYVLKGILAFASPVFKTMFTLPQDGVSQEMKDGLAVISVEEEAETLGILLGFCYPRWCTASEDVSLEKLIDVREAATKYGMDGVENHIRGKFVDERFIRKEPLRMYAITLRHSLETEVRMAARATLRLPILGRQYFEELECITAGDYHRLQVYHVQCAEAASKVAKSLEWMTEERYIWFECNGDCRAQGNGSGPLLTISGNRRKWVLSKWWWDFMGQAATALAERPSGKTITDSKLMDEALMKASDCRACRGQAFGEMRAFADAFALEVDRVTAEVLLEVKL